MGDRKAPTPLPLDQVRPAPPPPPPRRTNERGDRVSFDDELELRDYFAAFALQGVLFARATFGAEMNQESIAEEAYELADAMLSARTQKAEAL